MLFFKFIIVVLLILFVVSSLFGLCGFLIDIVRYPQKHEKVTVIPSAEIKDKKQLVEYEDGLISDNDVSIFESRGDSDVSDN